MQRKHFSSRNCFLFLHCLRCALFPHIIHLSFPDMYLRISMGSKGSVKTDKYFFLADEWGFFFFSFFLSMFSGLIPKENSWVAFSIRPPRGYFVIKSRRRLLKNILISNYGMQIWLLIFSPTWKWNRFWITLAFGFWIFYIFQKQLLSRIAEIYENKNVIRSTNMHRADLATFLGYIWVIQVFPSQLLSKDQIHLVEHNIFMLFISNVLAFQREQIFVE